MTYMPVEYLPAVGLDTVAATDSHGETVLGDVRVRERVRPTYDGTYVGPAGRERPSNLLSRMALTASFVHRLSPRWGSYTRPLAVVSGSPMGWRPTPHPTDGRRLAPWGAHLGLIRGRDAAGVRRVLARMR